jgi:hypothetical protein
VPRLGFCPLPGHNPGLLLAFSLDKHLHLMGLSDSPLCRRCGERMKPLPTLFVSVKLWLHSYRRIWAPSSCSQKTLRVYIWGSSGTLVKQEGSHTSIWGKKGPSIKVYVFRFLRVSKPIANHSIISTLHHIKKSTC